MLRRRGLVFTLLLTVCRLGAQSIDPQRPKPLQAGDNEGVNQ